MKFLTCTFLLLSSFFSLAQNCYLDLSNNVSTSHSQIKKYFANKRQAGDTTYIPLKIHAVVNEQGNTIDLNTLYGDIEFLNKSFLPINVQFYICSAIDYIRKPSLYTITSEKLMDSLSLNFNESGTINLYYVGSIPYQDACGFSSIGPSSGGRIILANSCMGYGGKVLIHELGHFFNLFHPHESYNGVKELVSGSNCATGGDLICDTPADPDLTGKVNQDCIYIGTDKDSENQPYKPDVSLYMSYGTRSCLNKFSPQQYQRMRYYLENTLVKNVNCTMKTDITCAITPPFNKLNPGDTYQLKLAITNRSFVPFSGNITYTVSLKDYAGNKMHSVSGVVNKSLKANVTDTAIVNWPIALDFKEGIYLFNAEIDSQNLISEAVENNNSSKADIAIFKKTSEFTDIELKVDAPSFHYVGYDYEFNYTLQNKGTKELDSPYLKFFVSNDQIPQF